MHVVEPLACNQPHYSPCLLCVSYWDGSLTYPLQFHPWAHVSPIDVPDPTATHSSVCTTSFSSWVGASAHVSPSMLHLLPSCDLHVTPSLHSRSLQSCFHHQWTYLILQRCFASVLSTILLLHSLHLIFFLQLLFMMLLAMMLSLDVLAYKQLDVFVSRKAHRHLIDCIPKHALNGFLVSNLLETILPVLLRGRWTPTISGGMATLITRNLLVENQNEHEN